MSYVRRNRTSEISEEVSNTVICNTINEWIHSERDRAILKRRYIDGLTYERIADEFDLSERHVKSIVYKHETTIFKHIDALR